MPATLDHPAPTKTPAPPWDYFDAVDTLSEPPPFAPAPPRSLAPGGLWADLLLSALSPISHHDPATADKSNTLLFNRRRQLTGKAATAFGLSQAATDQLCEAHPAPADVADLLETVTLPEFAACCLTRLFLDLYNAGEGEGVFRGETRYALLETRLRAAAVKSVSLRGLWDGLCSTLDVGIHSGGADGLLLSLLSLPVPLQSLTLRAITQDYRTVVSLSRFWHAEAKAGSAAYAQQAGRAPSLPPRRCRFDASALTGDAGPLVMDVPHVTGNSLRHTAVRGPGWRHLAERLALPASLTGQGSLSAGVEAVFENGGNIRAGAKQPSGTFALAAEIRAAHPLLELLGGVTDSFDLGESRLHVGSWIICRENAEALRGTPAQDLPAASVSVFDLLDDVTATRQATARGAGQMIYNFETLCAGTQLLCRLHLAPDSGRLALGALAAAIETYLGGLANVGGQKARGFGWTTGKLLSRPDDWEPCLAEYEHYLDENAETLRAGLVDGTLGARARVVS